MLAALPTLQVWDFRPDRAKIPYQPSPCPPLPFVDDKACKILFHAPQRKSYLDIPFSGHIPPALFFD